MRIYHYCGVMAFRLTDIKVEQRKINACVQVGFSLCDNITGNRDLNETFSIIMLERRIVEKHERGSRCN